MEQRQDKTELPEFTEVTHEDKFDHYIMIRHHVTEDKQIQLACLIRFRHTFQPERPKPKKG